MDAAHQRQHLQSLTTTQHEKDIHSLPRTSTAQLQAHTSSDGGLEVIIEPPFDEKAELNKELSCTVVSQRPSISTATNKFGIKCIPGQPLLSVDDHQAIFHFLQRELLHDRLNRLYPVFWLLGTPQSSHISALHHQIVRGRDITITENPGLHLLWYYDKIYIKPLPPCLTSYAFWRLFLSGSDSAPSALRRAALGYIRSYFYLIRHQSDFDIALEKKLISPTTDFTELLYFLRFFRDVGDDLVTPRYQYGELRLSRLNLYTKFYLLEAHYHKVIGQYGPYLTEIVTPFVFAFAAVSVALAAMQVVLAVEQMGSSNATWPTFISVARGFSVACLFLVLFSTVFAPGIACIYLLRELVFALKAVRKT